MKQWQRWVQAPQTSLFRRILFQVHLWLGIALGLYILVISVSGSAVVLRPQFSRWFVQSEVNPDAGPLLAGSELQARIAEVYSQYTVQDIIPPRGPRRAVYVSLLQDGEETVFVEVKTSKTHDRAANGIRTAQLRRIAMAAQIYMDAEGRDPMAPIRFDIALVDGQGRIELIEGIHFH